MCIRREGTRLGRREGEQGGVSGSLGACRVRWRGGAVAPVIGAVLAEAVGRKRGAVEHWVVDVEERPIPGSNRPERSASRDRESLASLARGSSACPLAEASGPLALADQRSSGSAFGQAHGAHSEIKTSAALRIFEMKLAAALHRSPHESSEDSQRFQGTCGTGRRDKALIAGGGVWAVGANPKRTMLGLEARARVVPRPAPASSAAG